MRQAGLIVLSLMLSITWRCGGAGSSEGVGPGEFGEVSDASLPPDARDDQGVLDAASAADLGETPSPPPVVVTLAPQSHVIVVDPEASPSEVTAAEELRVHFEACTGHDVAVHVGAPPDDAPLIVVGQGPTALSLGVAPDADALGPQGALIRTVPPHLVIAGTPEGGTLYGVHRFVEEHLGVRWYAPGVTHVPARERVELPALDQIERPAFFWRHTSYRWPGADDAFWARQGGNHGGGDAEHPWGAQYTRDGVHSYFRYVSPGEFFDEHPEYFSEVGGVRLKDETQLCLTNPDVLDIVTERMLARMDEHPEQHQFFFAQQDHYNYCQCDACRAMNEQHGTHGGTQFWFVNQLAERTAAAHPDKLVGTLAYMYTEEAPKGLTMHPRASVWLCHMFPSCDSHPVDTCARDAEYRRRAIDWSGLTDHLYVWHYIVDFMHYYNPFPNLDAMAADMRLYRDLGVEGIYLQGMGHSGGGGEWSLLRPWFGMKLLWDPDQDADALVDDFLAGYYGAAAPALKAYIDRLHAEVAHDDIHMHLYTNPGQGYLSDEVVATAEALFDEAEAAVADDEELLERVRVARMPLVYARLFPRTGYDLVDGKIDWRHDQLPPSELKGFLDRMEAHGFTTVREASGEASTMNLVYAVVGKDHDIETIGNGALSVDVAPILAGRALRITHQGSGESVTAFNRPPVLYFPFAGGLEDRVGETFLNFGWVEPAFVTARGERSLTLSLSTMNGYGMERTYELDAEAPILKVRTKLTNQTGSTQEARFRTHMELDLGTLESTSFRFTDRAGDAIDRDLSQAIAGLREGEHFYDQDAPDGEWSFRGDKGLRLTQRFDPEAVDFTWVYAFPASLEQFDLEVWAHATVLEPGGSLVFEQEIEVEVE